MGRSGGSSKKLNSKSSSRASANDTKIVVFSHYQNQEFIDQLVAGFNPSLSKEHKRSAAEIIANAVLDTSSKDITISISKLQESLEEWSSGVIDDMNGQGQAADWAGIDFFLSDENYQKFSDLVKEEGDNKLDRDYQEWVLSEVDYQAGIAEYLGREKEGSKDNEWDQIETKIKESIAEYGRGGDIELEDALYNHGFLDFDDWAWDHGQLDSIELLDENLVIDPEAFLEKVYDGGMKPNIVP